MNSQIIFTPMSRCRVGIAFVDITPPVGIYHRFWGAAKHDRATGVHRPLRATAMHVGEGDTETVIVAIDHCLLRPDDMNVLREATQQRTGLSSEQILFVFSHTHSGGHVVRSRSDLPGGDLIGPYLDSLPERIAEAVAAAGVAQQNVRITYTETPCAMGHHRDFYDAANETYVCGFNPEDDTALPVKVARLTDDAGSTVGTIVNYPCHPTTLAWDNTLISPDYIGAMRETVEAATDGPCLFLLAPCGDIGPRHGFVGDTEVADRNGRQLAHAALSAVESMLPAGADFAYDGPVISGATIGAWLPREQTTDRQSTTSIFRRERLTVPLSYLAELPTVDETEAALAGHIERESELIEQGETVAARDERALAERCRRTLERIRPLPAGDTYPFAVELMQLGDAFWVFVEGEPYYDVQRDLQNRFPDATIVVNTLSNAARSGYLPSRTAYDKPTLYQVNVAMVAAGSLERVTDAIAERVESWLDS